MLKYYSRREKEIFSLTEFIARIFVAIFGKHSAIATVLISMLPIVELKGAIPVGMSSDFWGEYALGGTQAFLLSLLGSCLVVPILALVFMPLINWLKKTKLFRKIGVFLDNKVKKHSSSISKKVAQDSQSKNGVDSKKSDKKKSLIKWFSVLAFVSVPLPLTGVWTGTCVGVALGMKFWQVCTSVILGNVVAGLIIVFVCSIFPAFTTILFYIVLAIVFILIVVMIIKFIRGSKESADIRNDTQEQSKTDE